MNQLQVRSDQTVCYSSAAAAPGVPAGRLQRHADVHFLRKRRQAGEQRAHSALHGERSRAPQLLTSLTRSGQECSEPDRGLREPTPQLSARVEPSFVSYRFQGQQINEAACDLAREVADEGDALVAGGVSQTPSYLSCKSEDEVKATFKKQIDVFVQKNVDFLIAEVW